MVSVSRGRENASRDKWPRYSGGFSGALSGGREQFVRGQYSRPTYSTPPPSRGALVRPYFNAISESSYHLRAIQGVSRESMGALVYVSTVVGDSVVMDRIYQSCIVTFYGYETRADLLLLDITNCEVILGMDWFSSYHAIIDYHSKTVTLEMPELPRLEWRGSSISTPTRVISFLKARHMVEKGCLAYLAYVRDTVAETPTIDLVPVVREFSDVFPSDLPGMPLDHGI
ncbi:uncharacterized protein [Nicotiana tomentosiformis]|uniref:uncharacterized protein n=1 Tax=Nicotiana tomentosiformis TaxID=4098 RepID=UPI00388CEAF1